MVFRRCHRNPSGCHNKVKHLLKVSERDQYILAKMEFHTLLEERCLNTGSHSSEKLLSWIYAYSIAWHLLGHKEYALFNKEILLKKFPWFKKMIKEEKNYGKK